MSNYVNNVNVQSTTYAIGPLASTASGGIVDNISDSYHSYNNCIIHAYTDLTYASEINSTLMLNTNVTAGSYTQMHNAGFIGGSVTVYDSCECRNDMFINCSFASGNFVASGNAINTFVGLSCYYGSAYEELLLSGVANLVIGCESGGTVGFTALAAKTVSLYSYYDTDTGIIFPSFGNGFYSLSVFAPIARCSFDFQVDNGTLDTYDLYYYNSYYYPSSIFTSSQCIGISLSSSWDGLHLYISCASSTSDMPAQITLSYAVIPGYGGSGSGDASGSDDSSY